MTGFTDEATRAKALATRAANPQVMARFGNRNSWKHGRYSKSLETRLQTQHAVDELIESAYDVAPWLSETDRFAVKHWAEAVVDVERDRRAIEDAERRVKAGEQLGVPGRLKDDLRHDRKAVSDYEKQLGLTPASRYSMGVDAARSKALNAAEEIQRAKIELAEEARGD